MLDLVLVAIVALIAGAIASVAGFGIGSLLTPLFAWRFGTKLAVAAVSIPHLAATFLRFWRLRRHVDRKVFLSFGLTSAAGGLTGALFYSAASSVTLRWVFATLVTFAGLSTLTGLSAKLRFRGIVAWVAGFLSGLFGGLVGNQGGIRSAALVGFPLSRESFVATATASAVLVDLARMPAYAIVHGRELTEVATPIVVATIAALIGTLAGERVLRKLPETIFRRTLGILLITLGVFVALSSFQERGAPLEISR